MGPWAGASPARKALERRDKGGCIGGAGACGKGEGRSVLHLGGTCVLHEQYHWFIDIRLHVSLLARLGLHWKAQGHLDAMLFRMVLTFSRADAL